MTHPISSVYLDQQVAKVSAALPAAGAWDTPTIMACPGFDDMTLYFTYTRGAALGAFDFKIEVSAESTGTVWHQAGVYEPAILAAGVDSRARVQKEHITFQSQGAAAELFIYGPVKLSGTVERIQITTRESGVVGTPGTLAVKARFASEE